jgi:hypothetical protein
MRVPESTESQDDRAARQYRGEDMDTSGDWPLDDPDDEYKESLIRAQYNAEQAQYVTDALIKSAHRGGR